MKLYFNFFLLLLSFKLTFLIIHSDLLGFSVPKWKFEGTQTEFSCFDEKRKDQEEDILLNLRLFIKAAV